MIHASLFSGIGGPEVAAAMMGWENAFHCEINPFGRAVLEYWFPESKSYEDITKTDFHEYRGKIDVLTGGFPCQPFSYAGRRGGREDERYLWPEAFRVVDEIRPTWFIGENVPGITTMVEGGVLAPMGCDASLFGEGDGLRGYQLRETFTIERICKDLENLGYSVQPMLVPAAAVGAPHRRDRVFIIAHVADADRRDDVRVAGEHEGEGEGEGEGLQERDSIRKPGVADQLRPEVQRFIADTDCGRGGEIPAEIHSGEPDGTVSLGSRRKRPSSDSHGEGRQEPVKPGRGEDSEEEREQGWTIELSDLATMGMLPTPSARDYQPPYNPEFMVRKNGMVRDDQLCSLPTMLGLKERGGITFRLSPLFSQEMMGFPLMWLVSPFLSTSGEQKASKR